MGCIDSAGIFGFFIIREQKDPQRLIKVFVSYPNGYVVCVLPGCRHRDGHEFMKQ